LAAPVSDEMAIEEQPAVPQSERRQKAKIRSDKQASGKATAVPLVPKKGSSSQHREGPVGTGRKTHRTKKRK
jgi:hypothetical protein